MLVRQAIAVSGVAGMALTKLDVLDGFDTLMICTGYTLNGRTLDHFPAHAGDRAKVVPIYEAFDGWSESTAGARSWADLPAQAIKYIRPYRGADRLPGCDGVDVAGAGGHDFGEGTRLRIDRVPCPSCPPRLNAST